mmetsp:Transcript_33965/g.80439  ORF Transcript_33965/g.80439 Transcript_33965/m.80439 type:complete len:80 (+) Transcript_33965:173-412(+)
MLWGKKLKIKNFIKHVFVINIYKKAKQKENHLASKDKIYYDIKKFREPGNKTMSGVLMLTKKKKFFFNLKINWTKMRFF